MTAHIKRVRQSLLNPFGHPQCITDVPQVVEQDGELVAAEARQSEVLAEPRHHVAGPQASFDSPRHPHQQLISGHVSQAVVDEFEPVDVQEQDGAKMSAVALGTVDGVRQSIVEQNPIRKTVSASAIFPSVISVCEPAIRYALPAAVTNGESPAAHPEKCPVAPLYAVFRFEVAVSPAIWASMAPLTSSASSG